MFNNTICTICQEDAIDELECTCCKYVQHYVCALGFNPPEEFKDSDQLGEYTCPVCVVGSSYELLHRALDSHRIQATEPGKKRTPSPIAITRDDTVHEEDAPRDADTHTSRTRGGDVHATHHQQRRSRSRNRTPDVPPRRFIDLHADCEGKRKRLSHQLRSVLANNPNHATTLLLGDSLQKGLVKRQLDRTSDSVRIRSVGGLCVVATVQALLQQEQSIPSIKKLVFTLGINDKLHQGNHCHEESARYFKALEVESARVFPNAKINFVIPYKGMVGHDITNTVQSDLQKLLKENCPKIRVYTPPSLAGKVVNGGIHPNKFGIWELTKWYSKVFVPSSPQPFQQNSGRKAPGRPYSRAHLPTNTPAVGAASLRVPGPYQVKTAPPPQQQQQQQQEQQQQQQCSPPGGLAGEIVSAFTQVMSMWGRPPQQPPQINRYQGHRWPPFEPY